ncbi:aminotransferase class V-fold PLP-dependent enzyme [Alicyclobacillus sp. ALC3]|uniref:aminotransferase class V-fold PLP-dependent enzyme n=1 Tax=Alicyclobacillus sp. ALC3 TaxID=2796143 RepID=UPI00237916CD|nr:aminotransferase class V-fold PLP-dependent enzyme [Alicyclobacillus sp. ALC3]WDL95323.1 aminotransferase class V-fold PLP-dependent enzyme [Alicyclobacillus sp. ALC3]
MNLSKYRDEFPLLKDKIHLGNCSQSPQAKRVLAAMNEYLDNWRYVGMDWDFWVAGVEQAKASFARLINADVDEVAVLSSVSDCVSMIASCFPLEGKRHVVTTVDEFPTVGHVWRANQSTGELTVDFVASEDHFYGENLAPYFKNDTALLSIHHVAYNFGAKQDIAALAKLAHAHNAYIFVDAYQAAGTTPIDVKEMDIDMLASGNLKYLLGIPGIAFLYVRREVAEKMFPRNTGWFGRVNPFYFNANHIDYAEGAKRFNTGTGPILAAFAARGGMDFILEVGVDAIEQRIEELSAFTMDAAHARGLQVMSPRDPKKKGASTAIWVGDSHAVEQHLMEQNIIASARGDVIRIAPHFFTLETEIDQAVAAVAQWVDEQP